MKRITILIVLSFVFSAVFAVNTGLKNTIAKCKKAVVIVIGYDEDGKEESQGTGFFVNKQGHVATNVHVIGGSKSAAIKTSDEKTYPLKRIVNSDEDADLVIFSVDGLSAAGDYLTVRAGDIDIGDNVYVIGNPMGLEQTVSNGITSGIRKIKEFGFMYQITAPISPGSSGSPVMDEAGDVIGVATSQYTEGQNLNFVTPSEKLRPLLSKNANLKFEDWISRSYSIMPVTEYAMVNLGGRFYDKKKYKEAAAMGLAVIKKNPKYTNAYNLVAQSYFELDKKDEALKYMKAGVATDAKKEFVHNDLGILLDNMELPDLAAKEYYVEIGNFPKNYHSYHNLASLYYRYDMLEDAFRILALGIKKVDYPSALYVKAGDISMDNADYDVALEKYKQAIKLDRYNPNALLGLGRALLENDDVQGATDCYYALQKISTKKAEKLYFLIKH